MGYFAYEAIVKEIKNRLSIMNLVETYISLKKSGRSHIGLCPFHDDKKPSLHVNEEKGVFHCFACGAGGDMFGFLMRYNNITFPEAVKELAKRAGIEIQEKRPPSEKKSAKDLLFKINALASRFYHNALMKTAEGARARDYIKGRHITPEMAEEFQLGYAPSGWDRLVGFLNDKKVPLALAEKAGLVIKKNTGGYYDRFRERVIFPIRDVDGRVAGFGARTLTEEKPKYINSPESEIYRKGSIFYGLDISKDFIRRKEHAIVVEGYMDFLSLNRTGIKNVVATLGTSLTGDHAKLLRRYTNKAVVVFDGDESGLKASARVLEVLKKDLSYRESSFKPFLKEGLTPFMVVLPDGDDPDSLVSKGRSDEFLRFVESSAPLLDFFVDRVKKDFQNGKINRDGAVQTIMNVVEEMKDGIERSYYRKRTAEDFGITETELLSLINRREKRAEAAKPELKNAPDPAEKTILKIILKYPEHSALLREKKTADFVPDGAVKTILQEVSVRGFEDASSLLLRFTSSSVQEVISESILFSHDIPDSVSARRMLEECIRKLELKRLSDQLRVLRLEMDLAKREKDDSLEKNLMAKYKDLKDREKKLKGETHE